MPVVPSISLASKDATRGLRERENISLAKTLQQQVLVILLAIKRENTVGRHLKRSLCLSSCFLAASSLRGIPAIDLFNLFLHVFSGGDAQLLQASQFLACCFLKVLPVCLAAVQPQSFFFDRQNAWRIVCYFPLYSNINSINKQSSSNEMELDLVIPVIKSLQLKSSPVW